MDKVDVYVFHGLMKCTIQKLLRITFSFNDLMLKTNRLKKDFFYKDRLIFGLDDPVANIVFILERNRRARRPAPF